MIERERGMRKGEAETLVVADRRDEAGAVGKKSFERRRHGCCCVRARERARERVEERVWQRGRGRMRSGAPGGRPGCVHPGACAPRVCRTLPACHGVAARPSARVDMVLARGRGSRAGGLGRLRPAGQKRGRGLLAPPFAFSIFFEFFFLKKLKYYF